MNTVDAGQKFGDAQLAGCSRLHLTLWRLNCTASVTDGCLEPGEVHSFAALHLEGTSITGADLAKLSQLQQLSYVNLSGTQVTQAAVAPLASMKNLRHLYLFNTPAQLSGEAKTMNRREFCAITGRATLAHSWAPIWTQAQNRRSFPLNTTASDRQRSMDLQCGFELGAIAQGKAFGGTHGGIATDRAGLLYVSTQSETGVLVYDRDGKLLRRLPTSIPKSIP